MKSNTIYPPMSEREISGAAISREAATQGMVLLKNINGVLPLKAGERLPCLETELPEQSAAERDREILLTAVFPAVVIRMWISLCVIILIF
mgnify:FL=1